MRPVHFETLKEMDVVCVNGCPYLFTNLRVDRKTLPEGMAAYDVRDSCDGNFYQVANYVMVNHWGTIIGFDRIEEAEKDGGYSCFPYDGNMIQSSLTLDEFKAAYNDMLKESMECRSSYEKERESLKSMPVGELLQKFFALSELDDEDEVTASFVYDLVENTAIAEEVRSRYHANQNPGADLYFMYINALEDYFQFLDDEQNDELEEGETREEHLAAVAKAQSELEKCMAA